jgi:hypothetical protein
MIGKHKNRAATFTMAHATVLAVALAFAPLLGAQIGSETVDSEFSSVEPRQIDTKPVIVRATLKTWWNCDTKSARDVDV